MHLLSGWILGYDPGGNGAHGLAALRIEESRSIRLASGVCETVQAALDWVAGYPEPLAAGIDTLLAWSSGTSGDRAADRALRRRYREIAASVICPNRLYGSMCLNGAFMAHYLADLQQAVRPRLLETHPKVLYFALTDRPWSWS